MNVIDELIKLFRDAPRIGESEDTPEGVRYIQISDTLAQKIVHELRGFTLHVCALEILGKRVPVDITIPFAYENELSMARANDDKCLCSAK